MGNLVQELRSLAMDCDEEGKRICHDAADMIERMSVSIINRTITGCEACKERDLRIDELENKLERARSEMTGLLYAAAGPGR